MPLSKIFKPKKWKWLKKINKQKSAKRQAKDLILKTYKANFNKKTILGRPVIDLAARYRERLAAIIGGKEKFIETGTANKRFFNAISGEAHLATIDKEFIGNKLILSASTPEKRTEVIDKEIERLRTRVTDLEKLSKTATEEEFINILWKIQGKKPEY